MSFRHYPSPPWNQRKAVYAISAVVLGWVVADRLVGGLCDWIVMHSQSRFARLYGSDDAAYALLLGDSRGVNTFHAPSLTSAISKPVYSLAYNGCSTDVSAVLLEDWCDRHPPPKVVVVEVTSTLRDPSILKSLKMFVAHSTVLRGKIACDYPLIGVACDAVHSYRFNSEMFLRTLFYSTRSDQDWINRYRIPAALVAESQGEGVSEVRLGDPTAAGIEGLRLIKALCEKKGIAVRYVIGPYMPLFRDRIVDLDTLRTRLQEEVGIPIHDYSRALSEVACFADNVHMNIEGSDRLTRLLIHDGIFAEPR